MIGARGLAGLTVLGIVVAAACAPIEGTPRSSAPLNDCAEHPCEAYASEGVKPACAFGRCEAGKPTFDYVLVVSVPSTSFFAAGRTFFLRSRDFIGAKGTAKCPALTCIALGALVPWDGEYRAAPATTKRLGVPTGDREATLAASATFLPLSPDDDDREAAAVGLPSDVLVSSVDVRPDDPRGVNGSAALVLQAVVPPGRYQRTVAPAEMYEGLPPLTTRAPFSAVLTLSDAVLDDPSGDSRLSRVSRAAGLDGFRIWLEDERTGRRISSIRKLAGSAAVARLDTVGENDGPTLRSNVTVVLAPPEGSVGLPTKRTSVFSGVGLDQQYPDLPPPVVVSGTVSTTDASAAGLPAEVVFASTAITPLRGVDSGLGYATRLRSDGKGRFATVLPPGQYQVFVAPDRGLGWGRATQTVAVDRPLTDLIVPAQPVSVVEGRALLADGRPLDGAEVIAEPSLVQPENANADRARRPWLFPRSARARTDATGRFVVSLEEGTYDLTVVPEPGTGFPRLVSPARRIGPGAGGDTVVKLEPLRVPVPLKVAYTLQDPSGNVVPRAVVRAYTKPVGSTSYVEIGEGMTDRAGRFEILVAPQPR